MYENTFVLLMTLLCKIVNKTAQLSYPNVYKDFILSVFFAHSLKIVNTTSHKQQNDILLAPQYFDVAEKNNRR